MTTRTFYTLVRQSFRYIETIKELAEERDVSGIGSEESRLKDAARTRCHNATIDAVNIWVRSLFKNEIDVKFMKDIIKKPENRAVYGNFAVGLALDIYTNENFDISKYMLDN